MKLGVRAGLGLVFSGGVALALVTFAGCGDSSTRVTFDAAAPVDAGLGDGSSDASDGSDGAALPRDPCADSVGLAANAPWPTVGGCAKRPGFRKDLRGPTSGSVAFTFATTGRPTSPVVAEDGTVVFGTSDGRLIALSASGQKRWDVLVGGVVETPPVLLADGFVLVASTAGKFGKFALSDGAQSVLVDGPSAPTSPIPLADGTMVFTAGDAKMHVVSTATLVESAAVDVGSTSALTLAFDGTFFAAGKDGTIRKIGANQAVAAFAKVDAPLTGPVAVTAYGEAVLATSDGKLVVVDESGKTRFTVTLDGKPLGAPATAPDGSVYVATDAGKVHGYDRDGKEVFTYAPLGLSQPPVVTGGGTVVFGAEDTKLYAVLPSSRLLFAASLRTKAVTSGAFAANGTFFVGTEAGLVAVGP
jgi:outer membrane protein assembly factor BamB